MIVCDSFIVSFLQCLCATTAAATTAAVRTIHVRRNVRFQTALTDVQVGDAHDEHPRNHHEAEQRRARELVDFVL